LERGRNQVIEILGKNQRLSDRPPSDSEPKIVSQG